jgi:hypothetical protein
LLLSVTKPVSLRINLTYALLTLYINKYLITLQPTFLMNIVSKSRKRLVLLVVLILNSFYAFSQGPCSEIEFITNGGFSGGSTAGWTLGGGWRYAAPLGVGNTNQSATNHVLSQVISNPLTTQIYKLSFWMGTHDLNSANRSRTATLEIVIGGVTYAKFTNGIGGANDGFSGGPSPVDNVTLELFNGATSDFLPYGTTTGWVGSRNVNFNIPFNATSALNNEIQYIYNSTGDYFLVNAISLLGCESMLPVKLIRFTVKKSDTDVVLNWETTSESSNSHFDIEISSDAVNFSYLGTMHGNGTTEVNQNYSYVHKNPAAGVTYYRLKQVDYDGTYEYFVIRSIDIKGDEFIYPNPASTHLTLSNMAPGTSYEVLDGQGRLLLNTQVASQNSVVLDISALPRGTQLIRFIRDGKAVTKKFYIK